MTEQPNQRSSDAFFEDPRVSDAIKPEVLDFLKANRPPAGSTAEFEIGHWISFAAALATELRTRGGRNG